MSSEKKDFIGVVCDGDRRWAMERYNVDDKSKLTTSQLRESYSEATDSIRRIIEAAKRESVGVLAFWGLSERNFKARDHANLKAIFDVISEFFEQLHEQFSKRNNDIRFLHMGKPLDHLPDYASTAASNLSRLIDSTKDRLGTVVAFCLRYEGEDEQSDAIQSWVQSKQTGNPRDYLYLPQRLNQEFQPVDGIIRTAVPRGKPIRRGQFLIGYERYETALLGSPEYMPEYKEEQFLRDLQSIRESNSKNPGS